MYTSELPQATVTHHVKDEPKTCVFIKFYFYRSSQLNTRICQNLCVREVICTVRPNLATMPSLCHRQSELKTMVLASTIRLKFIKMCNWKLSRYLDVGQYRPISIFSYHLACFLNLRTRIFKLSKQVNDSKHET
jgi:hypothetical protein